MRRLGGSSGAIQLVRDSILYLYFYTHTLETTSCDTPASTLRDTYTCHGQLLCKVLIVCLDRHKMTTLTPSLHMESYSPDDNRFDLRFVHPLHISRYYLFPYVHLGKLGRVRIADDTGSLGLFSTRTSHGRTRKLRGVLRH
jgi:hypothetical protein